MTWVLVLNSNTCNVFSFSKNDGTLHAIKEFYHPENRGKNSELVSDRPGRYSTDTNSGGAYSPETDPKEVKRDQFILEICHWLEENRTHHKFEKLIVVAAAKMDGHLLQHMNKNVEKMIVQHIQKDVVFLKEHELFTFLMEHVTLSNHF
ncbi:MAG: host attachment protein [Coxiellaceae bacterium]|nr:host attachment protein [Coxiellaceae bacterium]